MILHAILWSKLGLKAALCFGLKNVFCMFILHVCVFMSVCVFYSVTDAFHISQGLQLPSLLSKHLPDLILVMPTNISFLMQLILFLFSKQDRPIFGV